ncbi:hypothetical protein ACHWQZ_G008281 [Mnemiopsis leidyi]
MKPKSAWFDIDCIKGKRELNRTAKRYGADPTNDLLRALYYDQRKSYRRLIKNLCQEAGSASLSPKQIRGVARSVFQGCWNRERKQNRKLCFYNSTKDKLEIENYLQDVNLKPQQLKRIAQMRTSSHRLNIETGRHGIVKRNTVLNRVCHHCSDLTYLEYLAELPFFDPICEDEIHVLKSCPLYEDLRTNAHPAVKEHLQTDLKKLFTDKELLPRFGCRTPASYSVVSTLYQGTGLQLVTQYPVPGCRTPASYSVVSTLYQGAGLQLVTQYPVPGCRTPASYSVVSTLYQGTGLQLVAQYPVPGCRTPASYSVPCTRVQDSS